MGEWGQEARKMRDCSAFYSDIKEILAVNK
jgi:hypothetical protein